MDDPTFEAEIRSDEPALLYSALVQLPPREQKLALRHLPHSTRRAVWLHHTDRFLERHPELNDAQRAIIQEVINAFWNVDPIASPEFAPERREDIQELKRRAETLLGANHVYVLFYRLGDDLPFTLEPPCLP